MNHLPPSIATPARWQREARRSQQRKGLEAIPSRHTHVPHGLRRLGQRLRGELLVQVQYTVQDDTWRKKSAHGLLLLVLNGHNLQWRISQHIVILLRGALATQRTWQRTNCARFTVRVAGRVNVEGSQEQSRPGTNMDVPRGLFLLIGRTGKSVSCSAPFREVPLFSLPIYLDYALKLPTDYNPSCGNRLRNIRRIQIRTY